MNSHRVNWSHYDEPVQPLESSVSEKLALYGSSSLSGVEHLRLLIGTDSLVDALLRHFGSLKALSRASFKELRQFLPKRKAEAVIAALSISNVVETEHALSAPLSRGSFQQRCVKRHAIYHNPDIHNEIRLFAAPKIRPTSGIQFLGA
jgi:DNA repair protein RadC